MSGTWPAVLLGEVLTERQEIPSADALANRDTRIVAKIGFNDGKIQLRTGSETKTGMILVRPGDLLISGINAVKGAIAIYGEENTEPIAATIHYGAYQPNKDRVDVKYLWWLLRSGTFRDLLYMYVPGGIKTELKAKRLLPIPVPLPSLEEQQRIVAKIDSLAAKIEEARSIRLQATKQADAFMGTELGMTFRALAKRYPVYPLETLTSHIIDGPHLTPQYLPEGVTSIPFVTVKNMVSGRLKFDGMNYISEDDHRLFSMRCRAERGDVLYSKDGATRGCPCLVDTDREFSFFVSVALIKPLRHKIDSNYLVHLLRSSWIRDRMIDKSRGDMIPHIVLREIRAFPVPLPPISEQRQIVAELDTLQADVDTLKRLQAETATELDALLPSILDKAFKGEL
jgi:type I restriction enzyme S subunit